MIYFLEEGCPIYLPFPFSNFRFKNFSPAAHSFSLFTYSDLGLMWQSAFSRSYLVISLSKYFHFFFQQIEGSQKLHFEKGAPLLVCLFACVCVCVFACVCVCVCVCLYVCVWEGGLNFPEGDWYPSLYYVHFSLCFSTQIALVWNMKGKYFPLLQVINLVHLDSWRSKFHCSNLWLTFAKPTYSSSFGSTYYLIGTGFELTTT